MDSASLSQTGDPKFSLSRTDSSSLNVRYLGFDFMGRGFSKQKKKKKKKKKISGEGEKEGGAERRRLSDTNSSS